VIEKTATEEIGTLRIRTVWLLEIPGMTAT
jgi:hypothetical protein